MVSRGEGLQQIGLIQSEPKSQDGAIHKDASVFRHEPKIFLVLQLYLSYNKICQLVSHYHLQFSIIAFVLNYILFFIFGCYFDSF